MDIPKHTVIAIDGPAASGKSTVAELVAKKLGGYFVNTGEMYRAATWFILRHASEVTQGLENVHSLLKDMDIHYAVIGKGKLTLTLNGQPVDTAALRTPEVTRHVSAVSADENIRRYLVARQRELANLGVVVLEGRDIGTVVFADTPFKFFLTASSQTRARRRLNQKGETAPAATVQSVARDIEQRDQYDASRPISPLKPAPDAETICTDNINPQDVAEQILQVIQRKRT